MIDKTVFLNKLKVSSSGHLDLPDRKKIWLSYGEILEDSNSKCVKTEAYKKRLELAFETCRKVMNIWESHFPSSDICQRALKASKDYLEGNLNYDNAMKLYNTLSSALENTGNLDDNQLNAILVGHACVDTLLLSVADAYCEDIEELDEDLDAWDYSMYSAGAYAGGYPFNPPPYQSDPEKLRVFWEWYINAAL